MSRVPMWRLMVFIDHVRFFPRRSVLAAIRVYQRTISPDHSWFSRLYPGGYCKFQPTCSMYTYMAIEKYGVIRGGLLGTWRLLRCNPWSKGGYDPISKRK